MSRQSVQVERLEHAHGGHTTRAALARLAVAFAGGRSALGRRSPGHAVEPVDRRVVGARRAQAVGVGGFEVARAQAGARVGGNAEIHEQREPVGARDSDRGLRRLLSGGGEVAAAEDTALSACWTGEKGGK